MALPFPTSGLRWPPMGWRKWPAEKRAAVNEAVSLVMSLLDKSDNTLKKEHESIAAGDYSFLHLATPRRAAPPPPKTSPAFRLSMHARLIIECFVTRPSSTLHWPVFWLVTMQMAQEEAPPGARPY